MKFSYRSLLHTMVSKGYAGILGLLLIILLLIKQPLLSGLCYPLVLLLVAHTSMHVPFRLLPFVIGLGIFGSYLGFVQLHPVTKILPIETYFFSRSLGVLIAGIGGYQIATRHKENEHQLHRAMAALTLHRPEIKKTPIELLEQLLRQALGLIDADLAIIYLYDPKSEMIVARFIRMTRENYSPNEISALCKSIPVPQGVVGMTFGERRPISSWDKERTSLPLGGSWFTLPIQHQDQGYGVLLMARRHPPALGKRDLHDALELSRQTAIALHYAYNLDEVRVLSLTDSMTGLYNHRHFATRLQEECERSEHDQNVFSLLLIDLDALKEINDRYGHLIGDLFLLTTANAIRGSVRSADECFRYGGDEFVVLLPETSKQHAFEVAERIRTAVSSEMLHTGEEMRRGSVSIGIASYPEDGNSPQQLMDVVDKAMYQAKARGRNQVVS